MAGDCLTQPYGFGWGGCSQRKYKVLEVDKPITYGRMMQKRGLYG